MESNISLPLVVTDPQVLLSTYDLERALRTCMVRLQSEYESSLKTVLNHKPGMDPCRGPHQGPVRIQVGSQGSGLTLELTVRSANAPQ